jgi:hypothetical protein
VADPYENVNDLMEELENAAFQTSQGSFVRIDHVRRLLTKREKAAEEAKEKAKEDRIEHGPPPKTLAEARRRAAADLKAAFPSSGPREPGKHVEARQ